MPQPDFVDAYVGLGVALEADGYTEDSMIALRSAVEMGCGTTAASNFDLGAALARRRQYVGALRALNLAVELDPKHEEAWFELAATLRKVREPAQQKADAIAREMTTPRVCS